MGLGVGLCCCNPCECLNYSENGVFFVRSADLTTVTWDVTVSGITDYTIPENDCLEAAPCEQSLVNGDYESIPHFASNASTATYQKVFTGGGQYSHGIEVHIDLQNDGTGRYCIYRLRLFTWGDDDYGQPASEICCLVNFFCNFGGYNYDDFRAVIFGSGDPLEIPEADAYFTRNDP